MNPLTIELIHNLIFAVHWKLNFSLNQIQIADRELLLTNKYAEIIKEQNKNLTVDVKWLKDGGVTVYKDEHKAIHIQIHLLIQYLWISDLINIIYFQLITFIFTTFTWQFFQNLIEWNYEIFQIRLLGLAAPFLKIRIFPRAQSSWSHYHDWIANKGEDNSQWHRFVIHLGDFSLRCSLYESMHPSPVNVKAKLRNALWSLPLKRSRLEL